MNCGMSAIGPKRTSQVAAHMSAFGGKADIRKRSCLLSRSLLGVKRTSLFAAHMSAFDPKRTWPALKVSSTLAAVSSQLVKYGSRLTRESDHCTHECHRAAEQNVLQPLC